MIKTYKTKLPKNIKVRDITSYVKNNELITMIDCTVSFTPKSGDFIYYKKGENGNSGIFIFNKSYNDDILGCYCAVEFTEDGPNFILYKVDSFISKDLCRPAKEVERFSFLQLLEKEGNMKWNEEKKCMEHSFKETSTNMEVEFNRIKNELKPLDLIFKEFNKENNYYKLVIENQNTGKLYYLTINAENIE